MTETYEFIRYREHIEQMNVRRQKASFIEEELAMLVSKINPDVKDLRYEGGTGDQNKGEEYCYILFANGHKKKVCITADSLSAITKDVLRAIE